MSPQGLAHSLPCSPADRRAAVLHGLALDSLALRVIAALREHGISVLLLKGPVTQTWLYTEAHAHPYTDVDLLVAPDLGHEAARVLAALGLRDCHRSTLGVYRPPQERAWFAPEGAVDLHTGIVGIPRSRTTQAWDVFLRDSEPFALHGREVAVMSAPARTLHLALHAAQRLSGEKARRDVARAVSRLPAETWRQAAHLAEALGAEAAFTCGLASVPAGSELLAHLDVRRKLTTESVLHSRGADGEALALAYAAALPRGDRLQVLRGWFNVEDPTVTLQRLWFLRLAALRRMPRAFAQWVSAHRAASRSGGSSIC